MEEIIQDKYLKKITNGNILSYRVRENMNDLFKYILFEKYFRIF